METLEIRDYDKVDSRQMPAGMTAFGKDVFLSTVSSPSMLEMPKAWGW